MKLPAIEQVMKKCTPYPQGGLWGGYLQPIDIVALVEAGIEATAPHAVRRARDLVADGVAGGRWFYFRLGRLSRTWAGKPSDKGRKT